MADYTTVADVKTALSLTGETFADTDITRAIAAASRGIDELCQDRFFADGTAVARFFDPEDCDTVKLRPSASSITSVKLDEDGDGTFETTVAATDYHTYPYNAAADSKPWWELRLHPNSTVTLPVYPRSVEVTALFGWSTTPDAIEQATVILAAKLLKRTREAPFGIAVFGMEGGEAVRIARNDPDVMFLAGPYMRSKVGVA